VTTTPTFPAASQQAAVDAALLVLKSMGLSLDDLLSAGSANRKPVPTFAEYVPVVAATVTPGTLRAYRPYWHPGSSRPGGRGKRNGSRAAAWWLAARDPSLDDR
jgi:hypothetical protein